MTSDSCSGTTRDFVYLHGIQLRVFRHGGGAEQRESSDAVPLVLIHGAGGSYLQWPPEIRRISGLTVLAPDLPGHGESFGDVCSDIQSYARVVGELLEVLGISRCVVVGHSMGGAIALELTHQAQICVVGVGVLAAGERLLIPDELMAVVRDLGREAGRASTRTAAPADWLSNLHCRSDDWLLEANPDVLVTDLRASRAFDARPYARELHVPALVVAGSEDRIVPVSASESLHSHMPCSEFYTLEGAGHMFMWERTEEVIGLILELVKRANRHSEDLPHRQKEKVCS